MVLSSHLYLQILPFNNFWVVLITGISEAQVLIQIALNLTGFIVRTMASPSFDLENGSCSTNEAFMF